MRASECAVPVCQEECVQVFTFACLWICVHCCYTLRTPDPPSQGPRTPASVLLVPRGPPAHGGRTLAACKGLLCTQGTTPRGFLRKCELKCRRLSLARLVFTHTHTHVLTMPVACCSQTLSTPALCSAAQAENSISQLLYQSGSGHVLPQGRCWRDRRPLPISQEAALAAPCVFCSSGS